MADVVAVAHVGHPDPRDTSEPLADRHHVCERLARVVVVREPVDDRNGRVRGQLVDVRLVERPDQDRVEIPREDDGGVADGLRLA